MKSVKNQVEQLFVSKFYGISYKVWKRVDEQLYSQVWDQTANDVRNQIYRHLKGKQT